MEGDNNKSTNSVPGYTATMEIAGVESMENVNVQPPVIGFERPEDNE